MPRVSSSAVREVDYDGENRELFVTFAGGGEYAYLDVPEERYDELLEAPSIGACVNQRIKPFYEAWPVHRPDRPGSGGKDRSRN